MTACTSKQDLDAFGYLKDVELFQDPMDFRTFDLKFVCPILQPYSFAILT